MAPEIASVIVGTDFSEAAGIALVEARQLAERMGTRVTLVHVEEDEGSAAWRESGEAGEWLERAAVMAAEVVVRQGSAWVELARCASELGPLLIVVGSHGRSGYQPLTLGSTAARLTLQARCPVMLVSPRAARRIERPEIVAVVQEAG